MAMRRILVAILLLAAFAVPGAARELVSQEQPVLIMADELHYDEELGTVVASGNVEIIQGDRTLLADTISYNQKTDVVSASGNVVLHEPTGEVLFAEFVELRDELKNGIVENIRLLLSGDSRFAANKAERRDGNRTIMSKAVYSPCKSCKDHPERPVLWRLRAEKIEHDQEDREVRYRNVFLEMFDVPVFYTPYFSHPDPTVDRKSGFLAPDFGTGGNVGAHIKLPYYIVLDDDKDGTVAPIYTEEEGLVISGDYRQRFDKGYIELTGSITEAERKEGDPNNPQTKSDRVRGHVTAHGRYDIDDTWRAGLDIDRSTDRSYLRKFNFFELGGNTLLSNVFVEGFRQRNYLIAQGYSFQDLRTGSNAEQPFIAPIIDYSHFAEADRFGGRWALDSNFRYLTRDEGDDSLRFSFKPGYEISRTLDLGIVTKLNASVQADVYHINRRTSSSSTNLDDLAGRALPRLTAEMRYPFVRQTGKLRQLIEPIVMATVSPNGSNPVDIPDEDSRVFELDDTNILSEDRFSGLDRVESGQRAVVGINLGLFDGQDGRVTAFFGQSFRFHKDEDLQQQLLLENDFSDYVGRIEVKPHEYLDVLYRFRFSKDDFATRRSAVSFRAGPAAFNVSGDYFFVDDGATTGGFDEREELTIAFNTQINDFWSASLRTRRDMTDNGGSLLHALQVKYEDECFVLIATAKRSFTRDADIEPSDRILFQFIFKNLGQTSTTAG